MPKKNKLLALIDSFRQRLNDAEGDLSKEEINKQIDELMAQLEEVQGKEDEESKAKADELQKQIDELKAKLEKPTDADPATSDDTDTRIIELTAELEQVKKERDEYKARVEELEAEKDKNGAMNDAKVRFPRVNFNDAKTAKDIYASALVDAGIYTKEQTQKLTDAEIRAAYAGLVATSAKKNKTISSLLNDSKEKQGKSASARLGGK